MQCILGTSNPVIMAVRAPSLVLLFTFVSVILGLPTGVPESAVNAHEEHTLSTELLPPPTNEKEHHATIYIINLYAVKNGSSNASEEIFQNEVVETLPDIMDPLVSVLLVVEDEDEEFGNQPPVDLDEFAEGVEGHGYRVHKIDLNSKAKVLKMKLEKTEADSMIDSALKGKEKKNRQKRTLCLKCGGKWGGGYLNGGGHYPSGGGGGDWGGYPSGGGHYPGGGEGYRHSIPHVAVIPVVVVPITGQQGHHGGQGGYPHGGGGSGGGGGCGYGCGGGGGGGGGGGWSHSSASAQATSSSGGYGWGKK